MSVPGGKQFCSLGLKSNEGFYRYRVARHNMSVMFLYGLDFPLNFLNPGTTNTTAMDTVDTHCPHSANAHLSRQTSYGSYSVVRNEVSPDRSRTILHGIIYVGEGGGAVTGGAVAIVK